MSLFQGSSRSRAGIASDGSHAVICYTCKKTITYSTSPISKALCALCEASLSGKPLTAQAIEDYEKFRDAQNGISVLQLDDTPHIPGMKKFSIGSVGEGLGMAIGFLRRKPTEITESVKLAKSKRRGGLLSGLEVGEATELGGMDSVDTMLRRSSDKG